MANMSYCRFHNTLLDFQNCLDVLQEGGLNSLSSQEKQAVLNLIDLAKDAVEKFERGDYDFNYEEDDFNYEEDDYEEEDDGGF